jgi:hypothetical protein
MARISLDAEKKQRVSAAIAGAGGPPVFLAQRDQVVSFVVSGMMVAGGAAALMFGPRWAVVQYGGPLLSLAGTVLFGLALLRMLGGLPLGRYLFASGLLEVGLLGTHFYPAPEHEFQFQFRYARGSRTYLNTIVYVLRGGARVLEMVAGGSEAEVQAQTKAFEQASAELRALRARGDAAAVGALDPLA